MIHKDWQETINSVWAIFTTIHSSISTDPFGSVLIELWMSTHQKTACIENKSHDRFQAQIATFEFFDQYWFTQCKSLFKHPTDEPPLYSLGLDQHNGNVDLVALLQLFKKHPTIYENEKLSTIWMIYIIANDIDTTTLCRTKRGCMLTHWWFHN